MNPTYLFYDLETTGLHTAFDQAIQFASIRTNSLWETLDTENRLIALNPDIIPSPYAMITHHIQLEDLKTAASEWETIQYIHSQCNTCQTISLGYNTLSFDDDMLRFSFYRHLLPPYTHQYANNCHRADLFPVAMMYYLFQPDHVQWPMLNERVSLKLEHLNAQNQWTDGPAHDALVDVQACVGLAKALSHHEKMWSYCMGFFIKQTDQNRINSLPTVLSNGENNLIGGLAIAPYLGYDNAFQAPTICLGTHQHYKNQTLWLRLDTENLRNATIDNMADNTNILIKRCGEPPFILPLTDRFTTHLSTDRSSLMNDNLSWLTEHPEILQDIIHYHCHYTYPEVENADIVSQLYQAGFPSRQDEQLYQKFHLADPHQKTLITTQFSDPVRQALADKLMAQYHPDHATESAMNRHHETVDDLFNPKKQPPIDHQGRPKRNLALAEKEIEEIKNTRQLNTQETQSLDTFEIWLNERKESIKETI